MRKLLKFPQMLSTENDLFCLQIIPINSIQNEQDLGKKVNDIIVGDVVTRSVRKTTANYIITEIRKAAFGGDDGVMRCCWLYRWARFYTPFGFTR